MKPLKIHVTQSRANHKWYFTVVAGNNQIIAQSQAYKTSRSALKTIARLKSALSGANVTMMPLQGGNERRKPQ